MPRDAPMPQAAWRAHLALAFERRDGRTVLATRRHEGPLVVQKPLYPEGDATCHAIVVHPPGGIAGGDELTLEVRAGERAHALLTTPGAAKWYRTRESPARQSVRLEIAAGGALEWLPQESIVFDGARAELRFEAHLARGACLVAWEIVCLGRTGSGERFERGSVRTATRIVHDGRPLLVERGVLERGTALESPAGLAGHSVVATLMVAGRELGDEAFSQCRSTTPRDGRGAVTRMPQLFLARYRGDSSEAARGYFTGLWKALRGAALGIPAVEPRIWRT